MAKPRSILALDVGERRIGVAVANLNNRLARPLVTILNDSSFVSHLKKLAEQNNTSIVVIGLPRSLDGEDTPQTKFVREFADNLRNEITAEMFFEDEALSSVRAKEALDYKSKSYKKEEIDAMAAAFILDDFIANNGDFIND